MYAGANMTFLCTTVGVVYFLVFGTQRDVFRTWCFWLKDDARSKTETTETSARTLEDITMLHVPSTSVLSLSNAVGKDEAPLPVSCPIYSQYSTTHYTPKGVHILVTSTRSEA